ncbi:MAG: aspartate 1-decarboxylase [Dehalococcoidia bacterium]|nr:aspartate 1-decarboxylase [Dehalococcoidia bacterium]
MRVMLHGKIHRATVTEADLHYVGSLTVDTDLLRAADILPNEQVLVVNLANGARLETYAIEGLAGSGMICANGAAAHHINPGDLVIIMSYHLVDDAEAKSVRPRVVFVDQHNKITGKTDHEDPGTVG